MSAPRVAIIGHMTPDPNEIPLPESPDLAKKLLTTHNFTRVVTAEGTLADHVAFLKRERGLAAQDRFTVWDMYLCGGLLLRSHLERNGFETLLVNAIDSDNEAVALAQISRFGPDIVVLSTTFVLTKRHLAVATKRIRKATPDAFIVAGGHHVLTTLMHMTPERQEQYLGASGLDGFIYDSQGEAALLALCQSYPDRLGEVPNLIWRGPDGEITHNRRAPETNDINTTLIDLDESHRGSVVHIRTARSCAFKCAFCSYPTIAGDLALMEIDHVIATLRRAKEVGVEAVIFVDAARRLPVALELRRDDKPVMSYGLAELEVNPSELSQALHEPSCITQLLAVFHCTPEIEQRLFVASKAKVKVAEDQQRGVQAGEVTDSLLQVEAAVQVLYRLQIVPAPQVDPP